AAWPSSSTRPTFVTASILTTKRGASTSRSARSSPPQPMIIRCWRRGWRSSRACTPRRPGKPRAGADVALRHLGFVDLPPHTKDGGFDHAAVHEPTGRIYVAHTANDAVDVIDIEAQKYVASIPDLSAVAGALVADDTDLVFTSNRGENTVAVFTAGNEGRPGFAGAPQALGGMGGHLGAPHVRVEKVGVG